MLLPVIVSAQSRPSPFLGRGPAARRSRNASGGRANAAFSRFLALVAAALVLVASLTAGRSYLWCSMMERAVEACCCDVEHAADEAPVDERSEIRNACCEDRALGDLAKARAAADAPELPAATLAALPTPAIAVAVPMAAARFVPGRAPGSICASPIRAGPRSAAQNAVRLQVFRC